MAKHMVRYFTKSETPWTTNLDQLIGCILPRGWFFVGVPPVNPSTPTVSRQKENDLLIYIR
jgi:hypothetical protein